MSTTILLADDHELMRKGLRAMLDEQQGVRVVGEAENGRVAVRLAKQLKPDLVIMDVTMPDLNGIDATRQIRGDEPTTKVIGLSMHPERQFVLEMLAASATGYLLKDSPLDELLSAIEVVMRGEVFLSPKVTGVLVDECVGGTAEPNAFCGTLSPREREVLQLLSEGKNAKEIGQLLHISSKTVEGHRRQIMDKLKLYSVAELTRYAIREGVSTLG
jgi:DNA-binding NarL/FixJ family response regulator